MGKTTGFLEYTRELAERRPAAERINDWFEIYRPFPEPNLRSQAARCMDCGVPFCHNGCPLTNLIPDWNDLVYHGRWREAVRQLHSTNNFPEFTGRICPAPCEASCVLGINEPPVTIKQIEKPIVDRGFEEGFDHARAARRQDRQARGRGRLGPRRPGRRAATGARRPRRHGLRKERPHRRPAALRHPQFQNGEAPDRPAPGADARRRRRVPDQRPRGRQCPGGGPAQASSTPSCWPAAPSIRATSTVPGRELKGIHFAMEFLPQQNRRNEGDTVPESEAILATGKRVVIIGGGDTGADCLGTSHRQGALSVTQFELLPKPPDERSPVHPVAAVAHAIAHRKLARRRRHARLERRHHRFHRRRRMAT